jgi:hypothetical protein
MGFIELNLYRHPSGATLDPEATLTRLKQCFPETVVIPGDQLAASVKQIEEWTAAERQQNPESPYHRVLASERRKAQTFGPAHAFRLPLAGEGPIRGHARKYEVTFLFDQPISEATRQRLITFLHSFGVGRIEASTDDARQSEILHDMSGPADSSKGLTESLAVSGSRPAEAP